MSSAQSTEAAAGAEKRSVFVLKYISEDTLYIDAGNNADLAEGMQLSVVEMPPDGVVSDGVRYRGYPHVAELKVLSVADASSVCEVLSTNGELKVGQLAILAPSSLEERRSTETARDLDDHPIQISFTSGDPVDQELRATKVEEPVIGAESPFGVMRARLGFSSGGIYEGGMASRQVGMMIDADMTHLWGTYWNFSGYWRGYLNSSSNSIQGASTQTLTDLINRTYTIGFVYQSPYSPNTVGVGRLYLPWAPSLSTIDGGYYGRKVSRFVTVGMFGGSTPDPTSWSYNPAQQIAGSFASFERGSFEQFHIISTAGIAVTWLSWKPARQFAFFENNLNWKRYFSLYSSMQVDNGRMSPLVGGGSNPTGISQTYNSLHFQPIHLVTFGVNYNYFRQLPTFDTRLIGTGVLNYLFTGLSGDLRFELPSHISIYGALGKSNATTDKKNSWNQSVGVSFTNVLHTGFLLDLHYSKFDSSFGSGKYASASFSKTLHGNLQLQVLGGYQQFNSSYTNNTSAQFLNATLDWSFARRYFLEGTYGWYNGNVSKYNQWSTLFGYRWGGLR
jgi:hypothetical protein